MTTHSRNIHTYDDKLDVSSSTSFSSNSFTSLTSTLDHLDSMTKYLEHKSLLSKWANDSEVGMAHKELVPLDLAVKEAQSRGSLLDRIASLEDRLIKLCLLIESKAACPSKSTEIEQAVPDATSITESKKRSPYSLSWLRRSSNNGDKETTQVCMDKFPVTEHKQHDQKSMHDEASIRAKTNKKCTGKKVSLKSKRESPSSWLHLKLLGC